MDEPTLERFRLEICIKSSSDMRIQSVIDKSHKSFDLLVVHNEALWHIHNNTQKIKIQRIA